MGLGFPCVQSRLPQKPLLSEFQLSVRPGGGHLHAHTSGVSPPHSLGAGTGDTRPPALPRTCPGHACRQVALEREQQGPGDSRSGGVKLVSIQEGSQAPVGDMEGGSQEAPPTPPPSSPAASGTWGRPCHQGPENLRRTTFCFCFSTSWSGGLGVVPTSVRPRFQSHPAPPARRLAGRSRAVFSRSLFCCFSAGRPE